MRHSPSHTVILCVKGLFLDVMLMLSIKHKHIQTEWKVKKADILEAEGQTDKIQTNIKMLLTGRFSCWSWLNVVCRTKETGRKSVCLVSVRGLTWLYTCHHILNAANQVILTLSLTHFLVDMNTPTKHLHCMSLKTSTISSATTTMLKKVRKLRKRLGLFFIMKAIMVFIRKQRP